MKKIILTSLIIFSSSISAHDLPNTFEAGQPIVASEVNENFAEIEAELNQIKSQLEALASESTNDSPQFLGFTSPVILSELGLQAGRELCPLSFEGSHICKPSDFQNLNDWSNFQYNSPLFLLNAESEVNPCSSFSNSGGQAAIGAVSYNKLKISTTSNPTQFWIYGEDIANWLANNKSNHDSRDTLYNDAARDKYFPYSSNESVISACNISLPIACCK